MKAIRIIKHKDLTPALLEMVCKIKSTSWNYSLNEQKHWIAENIKEEDLHILLMKDEEYVAYLNLIQIKLKINGNNNEAYGVGNVCAAEKNKGFGMELMKLTNKFLLDEKRIGLLFCKPNLIKFYRKVDWVLLKNSQLELAFEKKNILAFMFNFESIEKVQFSGKSF